MDCPVCKNTFPRVKVQEATHGKGWPTRDDEPNMPNGWWACYDHYRVVSAFQMACSSGEYREKK